MRRGQVWVETVIYTIIGLALIGLVLSLVTPRINERQNRIIVEQSIESVQAFDSLISEVLRSGEGNVRTISAFQLREGELYVNGTGDSIHLVLTDLSTAYSEPGVPIQFGTVVILTQENPKTFSTILSLEYNGNPNLLVNGEELSEKFSPASVPYQFRIENEGGGVVDISRV